LPTPLHVLIVDDSPSDTDLVLHELRRGGYDPIFERVDTQTATATALARGGWNLVIADYHLPGWSGLGALKLMKELEINLPFIVVSGTIGEETAVEAMRAGAHDYVLKDNLARLGPAVTREMDDARVRRERHQAVTALGQMARKSVFLAEASRRLGESLNFEETLEQAAKVAIPELADWCVITILGETTDRPRAIVAHPKPDLQDAARTHLARFAPERRAEAGAARVIKSGDGGPVAAEAVLVTSATREQDLQLVHQLGYSAGICLPLVAHGRTSGAITLVRATRPFALEDVSFAEELAERAATALDNAMLYRQAREAIRARDEFLLVASHELNTPLATLTLRLNDLPDNALMTAAGAGGPATTSATPGAERRAALIASGLPAARRQVQSLARLVSNLLDVSRITARRLVLSLADMDLVATLRDVLEQLAPELTRAKCEVRFAAPDSLIGFWDALRITQIGTNLISNALKYGAGMPIDVTVERVDDRAVLTVCDRGIGVAQEDIGRIFELFERSGAAKHFGGLGLGLYITRQVVEAHGGTIAVTSKAGEGALFTVSLPLRTVVTDPHTGTALG
jgi:signal transduction histidine kinase/FixJ family two-component response regulator